MHSLNAIQAWQFRRHQEKAWPLDYWLNALLPFSAVIWLALALAILKRTDQTFADLRNSLLADFLRGVATFMLEHGWLRGGIISSAAVFWVAWSTGHLWPGTAGHFFQNLHDSAGRHRWWSACLLVSGIFILAAALSASRVVAAEWWWWITVVPLLLMSWWVLIAFHRPEGPRLWQIMLWRAASIGFLVTSLILMFPNAAERSKNKQVQAVLKKLEEATAEWGLIKGWDREILDDPSASMSEEQHQVAEEVVIKFGEAKKKGTGSGNAAGSQDGGSTDRETKRGSSSDDSSGNEAALLRLLAWLFFLFGPEGDDGGGGGAGVAEEMVAATLGKFQGGERAAAVNKLKSRFGEKSRAAEVIEKGAAHVGAAPGSTQGPGVISEPPETSASTAAQQEAEAKKKSNP